MSESAGFALHPAVDAAALAEVYARDRRVQITPFLAESDALRLRDHLRDRRDWLLALRTEAREFEFDRVSQAGFGPEKLAGLRKLAAPADGGFTYSYERIAADGDGDTILTGFAAFLGGEPVLDLFRSVTGVETIASIDAKASRYGPGDFLSLHHDRQEGSRRIAAYVFGLTEGWRAEYGGLLLFHEPGSDVRGGVVPRMNALTLFAVPQGHSVSQVTAFAPSPRLSVAGWLHPS